MNILLTNDDGMDASGLKALARALPKHANAVVVAPANQKSASSHSITLGGKLRVVELKGAEIPSFIVHGTPADCVKIAISEIEGFFPDLVISGINQGANTGVSVYYSGTISAAREGVINRVPAMAISLCSKSVQNFDAAIEVTRRLIEGYEMNVFPKDVVLNVNVPAIASCDVRGIKITKQAASHFIEEFVQEKIHGNTRVYSLAGEIEIYDADGTSDEEAVADRFISLTPLKLDLTDYAVVPLLEKWVQKITD